MNKILTLSAAMLLSIPALADINTEGNTETESTNLSTVESSEVKTQYESPFISDEKVEEGFLSHYLNDAIDKGMQKADEKNTMKYGRKVTDYVSAPKFGGYFIGKYAYTGQDGANPNNEFTLRLCRFYVDGTILKDFAYRVQIQFSGTPHMKDYFIEWRHFDWLKIKMGQFKRAFGLENPMNPWDVGVGDYSQLTKKLTGHSDFVGSSYESDGGRDLGLQIQGDLIPIGKKKYRLIHYQLMVSNGQGINTGDKNSKKDITGTIQIQPIQGVFFGFMGWTGNFTASVTSSGATNNVTVDRNRYLLFAKYEKNDWSFRAEYAHSTGYSILGATTGYIDSAKKIADRGKCDAWYATLGIPCTKWLKTWLKYDVYRCDATWNTTKSIYSVCPVINLHKNLMFQPQFNYVHDRTLKVSGKNPDYCEFWCEMYVRF